MKTIIAVFICLLFAAASVCVADPFESAAPPTKGPDPFRSAPAEPLPKPAAPRARPTPTPEPEQVVVTPSPAPSPPPAAQWDGLWKGIFHCNGGAGGGGNGPEVNYPVAMRITDNNIARANAASQTPGTPGYDSWTGRVKPDGSVTIAREAVGVGDRPGTAERGHPVSQTIEGRFSGDSFVGWIPAITKGCGVRMTRANQ